MRGRRRTSDAEYGQLIWQLLLIPPSWLLGTWSGYTRLPHPLRWPKLPSNGDIRVIYRDLQTYRAVFFTIHSWAQKRVTKPTRSHFGASPARTVPWQGYS